MMSIKEFENEIYDLFLSGKSCYELRRKYHVNIQFIRNILYKKGIRIMYHGIILKAKDHLNIVKDFKSGINNTRILGEKYGVSSDAIIKVLNHYGIKCIGTEFLNRKYNVDDNYFNKIDTSKKAYILGLLYADGCNIYKSNSVTIKLKKSDKYLLELISQEIQPDKPLSYSHPIKNGIKNTGSYRLQINSKKISENLEKYGVVHNKTYILSWPDFLDNNLIPHFIRGFFDGDGSISKLKNKNQFKISFCSTNQFLTGLYECLIKQINISNTKIYNYKTYSVFHINNKKDILKFKNYIYQNNCDLYLSRKKDIFELIDENYINKNELAAQKRKQYKKLLKQGYNIHQIAKKLGHSDSSVRYAVKKYKLDQ